MIFYSQSNNGFFDDEIHLEIPADAVEITPERHAGLLDGQSNGFEIKPGADGLPVNAPVKPAFASGWDAATESWLINEAAKAAAEQAAAVKAQQKTQLEAAFAAYVSSLNEKYTGLDLAPSVDTVDTALAKCLACTAPDGTTGMTAIDCAALEYYWNKLKSL